MIVAIIEDDPEITEVVSVGFEVAWPGSRVVGAPNAAEGTEMLRTENPDILILDVVLPEGDTYGYDLCKELRSFSDLPIIIISARARESDILRGLESGAAAYLTKPFSIMELVARTRAVMRRVHAESLTGITQPFVSENLSVDFDNRKVVAQGEEVRLTPIEYKLLCYLVRNPGQILATDAILQEVWDGEYPNGMDLIKAHIQRLRKKLKEDLLKPRLILTERGRGYRFVGAVRESNRLLPFTSNIRTY